MAFLLRHDSGRTERVEPADPTTGFSFEEMYVLLGCEGVQFIHLGLGSTMILDENAKLKRDCRARSNQMASRILHAYGGNPNDWVSGSVLICDRKELQ